LRKSWVDRKHPVSHAKVAQLLDGLHYSLQSNRKTGLPISVCHFPPGTSKWNKIEHRLFSFISSNWRGEPLRDYETVVHLIAKTTTAKGLKVTCRLDRRKYPTGRKVSKEEMKGINLQLDGFHANGTISSDLISPEVVKGWRLVDTFIYLRSLSSYGSVVRPTGTLQNDAGAKGQGSRTPWLL